MRKPEKMQLTIKTGQSVKPAVHRPTRMAGVRAEGEGATPRCHICRRGLGRGAPGRGRGREAELRLAQPHGGCSRHCQGKDGPQTCG